MKPCARRGRARTGRARARGAPCRRRCSRTASPRAARRAPCRSARARGAPSRPSAAAARRPADDLALRRRPRSRRGPTRAADWTTRSSSSRARLRLRELGLEPLEVGLTCFSSSTCSGVGLPLSFWRLRSSSTCGTSSRQRSSAAGARRTSRVALARDRDPLAPPGGARGAKIDHWSAGRRPGRRAASRRAARRRSGA